MNATPNVSALSSYQSSPHKREPVLIIACGEGWIEVYAPKHIDARIEMMPHLATPEGERLAEQYVELRLPARYRDVYWPGNRRAMEQVREVRPSDIARREWELELLHGIRSIGYEARRERKVWML